MLFASVSPIAPKESVAASQPPGPASPLDYLYLSAKVAAVKELYASHIGRIARALDKASPLDRVQDLAFAIDIKARSALLRDCMAECRDQYGNDYGAAFQEAYGVTPAEISSASRVLQAALLPQRDFLKLASVMPEAAR